MRFGFISDIHGNLPALEAVLSDLERRDCDQLVCLGDICFGPQAPECLERVQALGCPVILGNWDWWSIDGFPTRDDPVGIMLYDLGAWWAKQLTDEHRELVRTFQPTLELELPDERRMFCFHGSPASFSDWIFATTPDEEIEQLFDGIDAAVLVGGHTHLQMLRRYGRAVIVNPGSVGQPFRQWWPNEIRVGRWAEYGIVDVDEGDLDVELRRVQYDFDAFLDLLAASDMPHRRWWIDSYADLTAV